MTLPNLSLNRSEVNSLHRRVPRQRALIFPE